MTPMRVASNKVTKHELRKKLHLTVPPRLEGAVKNAMMDPVRKPKTRHAMPAPPRKMQGYTERERKEYQLRSKRRV